MSDREPLASALQAKDTMQLMILNCQDVFVPDCELRASKQQVILFVQDDQLSAYWMLFG